MSYASTHNARSNTGRLYRTTGNSKGTGSKGKPTAIALKGRRNTKGGANPDGRANRP